MKSFQIMRYLKKLLPIIVILCVLATVGINMKLKSSNSYTASTLHRGAPFIVILTEPFAIPQQLLLPAQWNLPWSRRYRNGWSG